MAAWLWTFMQRDWWAGGRLNCWETNKKTPSVNGVSMDLID